MIETASDGYNYFPPEFVHPKVKEENEYGLRYAKAIYNCGTRYGGSHFAGSKDFDDLTMLAQGNQSVGDLRKLFGFHDEDRNDPTASLAYVDPKVLNLATKYVNRAVAKMQRVGYDIGLQCIDIVSIDEKEDYAASIQAFYRLKKWVVDMGYNPQELFPEIDVAAMPQYPDEMLYDIATNPKIKKEIAGELMIKLVHSVNRFHQKMRECDWDLTVYGRAHVHCYSDPNGMPRMDRIHPKFWVGSYVDNDDFEDQEYAGFFDFISVNQFIKETSGQMDQLSQQNIVNQYCNKASFGSVMDYRRMDTYDGLGYIPVLRFYFRSEDNRRYVVKKNGLGREILVDRPLDPDGMYELKENEVREIENSYTSIYGGTWVVDSDVVYNYKRQPYPRQELVNASLPIKTVATNFKEGRSVSFLAQMAEPLFMINAAWNKIKQILAEGRMGVMEIDFSQIEDVAMGAGGTKWTPKDVVSFLFKKNILIKRGRTNQYDQKIGNAIEMDAGGLKLDDYFTAFTTGIQMLESMTASSVLEQSSVPDRLAVSNAEMSQQLADVDMEYLYNSHEYLYQRSTHQMLLIAQGSLADGKTIRGFIPALGKVNTGYFDASQDLAYCEYGMFMTRQAGPDEKAAFYMDISIAVKEGRISVADSAFIREIDNIKQARQILAIREQIYQRQQQQIAQQQMEMQMQMNSQSAAEALQAQLQLMQGQGGIDGELMQLKGKIDAALQAQKGQDARVQKQNENQMKRDNQRQAGVDNIMRESVRNIPEKAKVEASLQTKDVDRERLALDKEKMAYEWEKLKFDKTRPKATSK